MTTATGTGSVSKPDASMISAAVALAKAADVTLVVVGTDLSIAHEGHDATNLTLQVHKNPSLCVDS